MAKRKPISYDPYNDLYILIGVRPSATAEEIQRAYRRRAKEVHPDLNPDKEDAKNRFQQLSEAYDVLIDPSRRAEYDYLRMNFTGRPLWWENVNPPPPPPSYWATHRPRYSLRPRIDRFLIDMARGPYRFVLGVLGFVFLANIIFIVMTREQSPIDDPYYLTRVAALTPIRPAVAVFVTVTPAAETATPLMSPRCSSNVRITDPGENFEINNDSFDVRGTATHENFAFYTVEIDAVKSQTAEDHRLLRWILSVPVNEPVQDGLLLDDISIRNMATGTYILRLKVQLTDGTLLPACEVIIKRKA